MKVDRSLGLLGVLLEPTTVVTKAWEQVQAVGQRAFWEPATCSSPARGPSACWRRWSVGSTAWTCTCWTAPCRAPSPSSFAPWGRRTTPGARRMSASSPTSSSSAPASARSSPTASTSCVGRRSRLPHGRRQRRPHDGLHRRCGRGHGAPEQRHRRQREREQTTLVQGGDRCWRDADRHVARRGSSRGASGPRRFMRRPPPSAGRHQGRHPVRRGMIGTAVRRELTRQDLSQHRHDVDPPALWSEDYGAAGGFAPRGPGPSFPPSFFSNATVLSCGTGSCRTIVLPIATSSGVYPCLLVALTSMP